MMAGVITVTSAHTVPFFHWEVAALLSGVTMHAHKKHGLWSVSAE